MLSRGLKGGRFMTSGSGGSTANAKAGKPSVTKFIQRIWRGVRGTPPNPKMGAAAIVRTSPMLLPRIYLIKRRILV